MIMLVYKVSIQILVEKCSLRVFEIFYTLISDSHVHLLIPEELISTMLKISIHLYLY